MKIANALGISINVFMDFEAEKDEDGSYIPSTIKISFKNSLLNHKLGVYMKTRKLQENLINDTERFSSEEEHQRAIDALSKDLDAVKQSILEDSKIVKKALEVYRLKYIQKMNRNGACKIVYNI